MKTVEIDSEVTHVFYPKRIGRVLKISDRFGITVGWYNEKQILSHAPRLIVCVEDAESIPKASEGLNCLNEEIRENEIAPVTEGESDDAEPQVEAPIEESANSEPLPEPEEDFSNYEDEEERLDLSHLIG